MRTLSIELNKYDKKYFLQHTPAGQLGRNRSLREKIHNELAEMFELGTNQRFCHVIRDHILSWTVFNLNLVPIDQVQ